MMIDWVSAKIPFSHTEIIRSGCIINYDDQGEREFTVNRFRKIHGSHDSSLQIRTLHHGPDGEISFTGNPAKFLQGHNLFGSDQIVPLMTATLEQAFKHLGLTPTKENWQAIKTGNYHITRVDLNQMYDMESANDAAAWIRAAAHSSRSRHKSGGILNNDSMYWGKNSRVWTIKVYAKGTEILAKGHELPAELPMREELISWAQNKLRVELTLRQPTLKKEEIHTAAKFANTDQQKLFQKFISRIVLTDSYAAPTQDAEALPRHLRLTFNAWKRGEDIRSSTAKNTFYRHRRALLEEGIDISIKPLLIAAREIPLKQMFEGRPSAPPESVLKSDLFFGS